MDHEIPIAQRRKEIRKQIIRFSTIGLGMVGAFIGLIQITGSSLDTGSLQIGIVDRGAIELSLSASGKLTPQIEKAIVCPIDSRILEVYKNPGDSVQAGEPLLQLELASAEAEYKKMLDEKEMRKSKLIQVKIRLNNSLSELGLERQVKEMQMRQLYADLQNEKYLDSIGASTTDKVRRIELAYEEVKLVLLQLDRKTENEQKNVAAELRVQELELSMFEKTLQESARLLRDARILSPQQAILTYVNNEIGAQVTAGTKIAIISDLSRFKVNAEIADGHADKLVLGAKAVVVIGAIQLRGTIVTITPSSQNGVVNFTVLLDDASHPSLRSGLRTDVNVLYGLRSDVLRIPRSEIFNYGPGEYVLWVVEGDKARRKTVRIGGSSFEYVEVVSGLNEHEHVILSDMSRYKNRETVNLK